VLYTPATGLCRSLPSGCVVRLPITERWCLFGPDPWKERDPVSREDGAAHAPAVPQFAMRGSTGLMSLTVKPDSPNPNPADPRDPELHPLVILSLAVSLATSAGYLAGWPAGVSVLLAVISLFVRGGRGPAA